MITGVSLNDDETENTQGSRYCLVAIGRLQVFLEIHFYNFDKFLIMTVFKLKWIVKAAQLRCFERAFPPVLIKH